MMKDCETRQQDLKAYLDGELPPGQRIALRWHLMRCARCQEERDAMMEISRSFKTGDSEALDPALRDRILSSVTYSAPEPEAPPRRQRRSSPLLFVWGAAAAGVLAGVFLRPLLLHDQALRTNASAPPVPSAASILKSEPPTQRSLPSSASGGAATQSPMKSPASPAPTVVPKGEGQRTDSNAPAASNSVLDQSQNQSLQNSSAPQRAAQDSSSPKVKVVAPESLQNNQFNSVPNQANQSQDYLSTDNAKANAAGKPRVIGAQAQQPADRKRRLQFKKTEERRQAARKAKQNERSKSSNQQQNTSPSSNAPPTGARK